MSKKEKTEIERTGEDEVVETVCEELQNDYTKLAEENSKMKDSYLRLLAEFDNYRKRQEKILNELVEQERNNIVGRLLDISDDFERVTDANKDSCDPKVLAEGIQLIANKIADLLKLEGLTVEDPTGCTFDPLYHDAICTVPVDNPETNDTVVQTLSKLYKRGARLVRPAKVMVGKYEPASEED
jgi:molecular chaperone GrpE